MTAKQYRLWTDEEVEFLRKNHGLMSYREMAEKLNRSPVSISRKAKREKIPKIPKEPKTPTQREFAVYQGDKFLFIGSMEYACERLGVSEKTFRFYLSPSHKNRATRNSIHVVDLGLWKIEEEIS